VAAFPVSPAFLTRFRSEAAQTRVDTKNWGRCPVLRATFRECALHATQNHAASPVSRAVNRDLILLYWDIGRGIVEKQQALGWGESVIDRLSSDLRAEFPQSTGFSPRNLRDMKRFYLLYSDDAIWRQAVAKMISSGQGSPIWPQAVAKLEGPGSEPEILRQLVAETPWGYYRLLTNKVADPAACLYYLRATAQLGWSRNVMLNQINRAWWQAWKI